jgi:hypothetical protein
LPKVNENLIRCKAEAAKVAAAEREKKKIHDPSPVIELEKKTISKKRVSSISDQEKHVVAEEAQPEDEEPARKRVRTDPFAETDEEIDIFPTPQIEPSTRYPPKGKELEVTKELLVTSSTDPDKLEERDARGKCVAEMIQKQIMMVGPTAAERVAGLVDVIDEAEELCYIDDDIPVEKPTICLPHSVLEGDKTKGKGMIEEAPEKGQRSGLKADNPIELEAVNIEQPSLKLPLSPRVSLDDAEK